MQMQGQRAVVGTGGWITNLCRQAARISLWQEEPLVCRAASRADGVKTDGVKTDGVKTDGVKKRKRRQPESQRLYVRQGLIQ